MAGDLSANIKIGADVTGVDVGITKAKKSLADLGAAAKSAGAQASQGLAGAGDGGQVASAKIDRATQSIINSIQRTTATTEAGGKATSEYFRLLGQQRGISGDALKPYLDSLDAANAKANAAIGPEGKLAVSARQLAIQHQIAAVQVKDFIEQVLAGGSPLRAFAQQGAAVVSEYGGVTQTFTKLGALLTPFVVTVGGSAAALALFGTAAFQGAKESKALADALVLTGDASGATYTGLNNAAKGISAIAGTRGAAADALAAIAATGLVAAENLQKFGLVAVKLERDLGTSLDATAKQFAELGRSPVDASVKLNESLNYLTASTYAQIKAFADQGREADAAAAAQNAYADAMLNRTADIEGRLGTVARGWNSITDAAKAAWDAMLNIGREASLGEQLDKVNSRIEKARKPFDPSVFGGNAEARAQLPDLLAQQAALSRRVLLEDKVSSSAKASSETVKGTIAVDKLKEQTLSRQEKLTRALTQANEAFEAAQTPQADRDKIIANIKDQYKDPAGKAPVNLDKSNLNFDIGKIKDQLSIRNDTYRNADAILAAQQAAGLTADADYYAQQRALVERNTASTVSALDAQIAARKSATFTGDDAARKTKDNATELGKLEAAWTQTLADQTAQVSVLDITETAAQKRRLAGYLADDQAAQRSLALTQQQYDLDLALSRLGAQEASRLQGRAQITQKYSSDLQALNDKKDSQRVAGTFNADAAQDYEKDLARIQNFQQKSLESYDAYYARRKQEDADYQAGRDRATSTYIENAQNVAKLTEQAYANTFANIEDALVSFVTTGKLNFKSLADSIIAEFVRIEVKQATSKLLSSFSSGGSGYLGLLGSIAGAFGGTGATAAVASNIGGDSLDNFIKLNNNFTGRAAGGPVSAGGLYEVNERGPELLQSGGRQFLMMGSQGGNVVPNGGSGTGGVTIVNHTSAAIGRATETRLSNGERAIMIEEAANSAAEKVAAQHYDPNSRVSKALYRNYNLSRPR